MSYPRVYKTVHLWFSLHFSVQEKKSPIKFHGVFVHFSRNCEVAKFSVIKLCLDVSNAIHANEHTKYANCGLPLIFGIFLLMQQFFIMKNDHFKQNLLLWPQFPFNVFLHFFILVKMILQHLKEKIKHLINPFLRYGYLLFVYFGGAFFIQICELSSRKHKL